MKTSFIGAVIESVFYAGRPKVDKRLDRDDFIQLAKMAAGTIMRKLYYEERQNAQHYWFFSADILTKEFELGKADSKGRREIVIKSADSKNLFSSVVRLPNGMGIFSIRPTGDIPENVPDHIARAEPGSEWLYRGRAYEGKPFWIPKGERVVFFNLDDCIKKVEVDGIFNLDDLDIPIDIAFDVVNAVLGLTLKVAGFPIDKTNNNDPNLLNIKSKLSNPEIL